MADTKQCVAARPVTQCVILIGGLGTRLGDLTRTTPKPLLPIGSIPFVEVLLGEASRRQFRSVLLLAGHLSETVIDYVKSSQAADRFGLAIDVVVEPEPLGTGGALVNALPHLDDVFLLLNGDTWFDFNWLDLVCRTVGSGRLGGLALRRVDHPDRFETVAVDGDRVVRIVPRQPGVETAYINGGVYVLRRAAIETLAAPSSIEGTLLPALVADGQLIAHAYDGFFIDIGVPDSYAAAQTSVPARRRRPAVFLDRDGVINVDHGYVHRIDQLEWIPGAPEAIKRFNDAGFYVFVVSNQAGVAHGYFSPEQVEAFNALVAEELRLRGAHIDDWRYCPYHPDGVVECYRGVHPWRKPAPGMLLDLLDRWPVDKYRSVLIGDQETDLQAAKAAGVQALRFVGGNLAAFAALTLPSQKVVVERTSP